VQFLFIDWLDSLVDWQAPGAPIDGVCRPCEDSRLREIGVFSVLPHDLLHRFVADVALEISDRTAANGDRDEAARAVYSEVEAILPEVAELWEQHASPRLFAWIREHMADCEDAELDSAINERQEAA
jgi:hypothetical protein